MDCTNYDLCALPAQQGTICHYDGALFSAQWYQDQLPASGVQGWSYVGICATSTDTLTMSIQGLKFSVDAMFFLLLAIFFLGAFGLGLKVLR